MEVGLNNGGISFTRKDTQRIKTTELPAKAGLQFEKFTQIITIGFNSPGCEIRVLCWVSGKSQEQGSFYLPNHVVIGSYIPGYQQEPKPKTQRSEFAPTISSVHAPNHAYAGSIDSIYNLAMQSITPPSYHGINGNAG
ncbi:hypothetical protein ACET3Z_028897 [Daucus carota]